MAEEWKPVPGHGDQFVASTLGRVARVIGHKNGNGYHAISLKRSMKPFKAHSMGTKSFRKYQMRGLAHTLVALAFHGYPPEGKTQVNHLDGNRSNNRPDNLQWVTAKENIQHAWRTGLISRSRGQNVSRKDRDLIIELVRQGMKLQSVADNVGRHYSCVTYQVRQARKRGAL